MVDNQDRVTQFQLMHLAHKKFIQSCFNGNNNWIIRENDNWKGISRIATPVVLYNVNEKL